MTTAQLDRLMHHCHIVETGNESYRFQDSTIAAKGRIKTREQARKGGKALRQMCHSEFIAQGRWLWLHPCT